MNRNGNGTDRIQEGEDGSASTKNLCEFRVNCAWRQNIRRTRGGELPSLNATHAPGRAQAHDRAGAGPATPRHAAQSRA